MKRTTLSLGILAVFVGAAPAGARTKLTTLPEREQVRVDLRNPAVTLVEEERTVTLQEGANTIDFAWANVAVDKDSIQFRTIRTPGDFAVLNTNYPPNENALTWEVSSSKAGPAVIRISYLIYNLNRAMSYEATAESDESALALECLMTLQNLSGEAYANATFQLGTGKDFQRTLAQGESRRMLSAKFEGVPVEKLYLFDQDQWGPQVRMVYRLQNDAKHALGQFPLYAGKARLYQKDSQGTQAFLGEDWGAYTPLMKPMDLYLGNAKEVKIERFAFASKEVNRRGVVVDVEEVWKFQLENFKKDAVPLKLTLHPQGTGQWEVTRMELKEEQGELDQKKEVAENVEGFAAWERKDTRTLEITAKLPPTEKVKKNLYITILKRNQF